MIDIPTHDTQMDWLKNAYICYMKEGKNLAQTTLEMEELQIEGLGMSKFDSISCIVCKLQGLDNMALDNFALEKLKGCFQSIIPWSREIKPVIIRSFEITGIPLHLWSDQTISKIGSTISEVKEIHNLKQRFDSAEVSISLDEKRILQKSLILKEAGHSFQVWIQQMKEHTAPEENGSDSEICTSFGSIRRISLQPQENNNVNNNKDPEENDVFVVLMIIVSIKVLKMKEIRMMNFTKSMSPRKLVQEMKE